MTTERKHHDETRHAVFNPFRDVTLVIIFLTRLPLPFSNNQLLPLAKAAWAFPVAGILTGGVGGGILLGAIYLGLPVLIAIILGLMASVLISGGLHEDGLADVADGFGGGSTRDKKLEIMHDSRIGTYGVLALVFSVTLRITALYSIAGQSGALTASTVMLSSAMFSRGILPFVMAILPHARDDGLSKDAGRPSVMGVVIAFGLGVIGVVVPLYPVILPSLIAMLCSIVATFILSLVARRQIGGQTGDVIGASQQISEITFLISLLAAQGGSL